MIHNSINKLIATLLIVSLNWTGLSAIGQTLCYFGDTVSSSGNTYTAASLNFFIPSALNFSPNVTPLNAGANREMSLINDGTLGFEYIVRTDNFVGNPNPDKNLCDYLNLVADMEDDGAVEYDDVIADFYYNAGEFSSSTDNWKFISSILSSNPELQGEICNFDFVFGRFDAYFEKNLIFNKA